METKTARRLTRVETASLIRKLLKNKFPETKFSVRSQSYSGGASISVHWDDGPRIKTVDTLVHSFSGASFDGMNDLKSYQDCWLMPDGTARLAARPESYGGSIPGFVSTKPHPDAELVSFGADFVFCYRHVVDYDKKYEKSLAIIRENCRCEGDPPNDRFGNDWVTNLASNMARDYDGNETLKQTFARIVLRNG
jgi:hypothetical protein